MTVWNPAQWNDVGVVGIVIGIGFLLTLALQRGWLVLGTHHRETIDGYRRENDRLIARSGKDAESLSTAIAALTKKDATEDATARIMAAVRELVGGP